MSQTEVVGDTVKTAAMRAMLPEDVLERFFDGPFHYEELRNRVSAYVSENLARQDANGGAQPMDTGQIDKSEGEDEEVNAVQQRRPHDRSNQKHKQESDNERKPLNRQSTKSSPSASRQSSPRDKKLGGRRDETGCGEEEASLQMWWKGPPCQTLVHQLRTVKAWMMSERSRPVMPTVICLVWTVGDDTITTINSVAERNDKIRGGKELLAFFDSGAVDNALPKSVCTEYPQEATSKSQRGVGLKGANGSHTKHHGQQRFRVNTSARMCASR